MVTMDIRQNTQQLLYWYRGGGLSWVTIQLLRKLLGPIYRHEVQYILMKDPDLNFDPSAANAEVRNCVIETVNGLQQIETELPAIIPLETIRRRLETGCIAVFAYRERAEKEEKEIVGYSICERGVFSSLGRRRSVSSEVLFTHDTVVLPDYRGQRILQCLTAARVEYGQTRGIKRYYSALSPTNRSSYRGFMRDGLRIVGTVERISFLGGLFVWETPWEKIEAILADTKK